jgi:two-component system sensor histidine kinase MtrB
MARRLVGPRPLWRLSLRARVTAGFALGALALSVTLAVVTYGLASSYLLRQREASTLRQAAVNARLVQVNLRAPAPDVPEILDALQTPAGSESVLARSGRWYATSLAVGRDELPVALREQVLTGTPALQRFRLRDGPRLAIGIPLPERDGAYFEVFTLAELESTLRTLALSLAGGAAVTTLLGMLLGRWASGRALRPLADVSHAAAAIAGGRLDTRLTADDDASLAVLALSFNHMADALERRIERDARFASDVSHELRSPLTTMVSAAELLERRRDQLSARGREALDLLTAELLRFQQLVQDLLEISRVDAGRVDLALEPVRLAELVGHAVRTRWPDLPVDVAPEAAALAVSADKRRLGQVLANLLDNADRYAGGAVRIAVERAGRAVRIAVEDAGPGVAPAHREHIFERFSRGSGGGNRASAGGGTGLGLALVQEHIRLHGGTVWYEDRLGGGARFVVELPVVQP